MGEVCPPRTRILILFKRAAVFSDIHHGLKSNSKQHNTDCENFIDWFVEQAKSADCETVIFCGDWNHNRSSLNLTTMDSGLRNLEKLSQNFDQVIMIPGNHDLYYKDRRDINSTDYARHIDNVKIYNEITVIDDVALIPWLVGDEWKKVPDIKAKYMFGHFELPSFYMNAMVQMPDHGELSADLLTTPKYVFSGHFHKRQVFRNIHYVGSPFAHNYADAWDDDRGMMILDRENDKEPVYLNWEDGPKYRTLTLSRLIDNADTIIKPNTHLRVTLDLPVSYEESTFIKETFMTQYNCREITLIQQNVIEEMDSDLDISQFASVDKVVIEEINALDTETFDKRTLIDIYNSLEN